MASDVKPKTLRTDLDPQIISSPTVSFASTWRLTTLRTFQRCSAFKTLRSKGICSLRSRGTCSEAKTSFLKRGSCAQRWRVKRCCRLPQMVRRHAPGGRGGVVAPRARQGAGGGRRGAGQPRAPRRAARAAPAAALPAQRPGEYTNSPAGPVSSTNCCPDSGCSLGPFLSPVPSLHPRDKGRI